MNSEIERLLADWQLADKWRKMLYVSAPLRAPNSPLGPFEPHTVSRNTWAARQLAEMAWKAGWATICPHLNTLLMDGIEGVTSESMITGDETFMRRMLPRHDAAMFGPGWMQSEGCQAEHEQARSRDLFIVYAEVLMPGYDLLLAYLRILYLGGEAAKDVASQLCEAAAEARDEARKEA